MPTDWDRRLEARLEEIQRDRQPVTAEPVDNGATPVPEDDDDQDTDAREADIELAPQHGVGTTAAWAPVITERAQEFIRANPSAKLDVEFPRVFAEDASARIRDISVAVESGMLTHRRAAEMVARELGIEHFNYNEERRQIDAERAAGVTAAPLGAGDTIVPELGAEDEPEPKRLDLSGDAVHRFKRQQRQSQAEALAEAATALREVAEVLREPVMKDVLRDAEGNITGVVEHRISPETQDT